MRKVIGLRFLCAVWIAVGCAWAQAGPKVVVMGLTPERMAALKAAAPQAKVVGVDDEKGAMKEVGDAEGLIGRADPRLVRAGKKLRWVQTYSAGVAYAPFEEMIERNITLTNCKILQGPNIADHSFAMLLALTRRLNVIIPRQKMELWQPQDYIEPAMLPLELHGRTALIIGLGGIGTQIAQRANAFGMKVIGIDPKDIPMMSFVDATYPPDQLHELLPQADVIFMAAPLTPETEGVLGDKEFGMIKKGSYFIAVSRGMTYNTEAMMKALDEKRLAGAGLDVTNPEPLPKGHALWKFENVIITPHIAGASDKVWDRRMALVKENLRRFTEGEPLLNVVDRQRRY